MAALPRADGQGWKGGDGFAGEGVAMDDTKLENPVQDSAASRRDFLAPIAAGAAIAAMVTPSELLAATGVPSITIPKDIIDSLNEPVKMGAFAGNGMTG